METKTNIHDSKTILRRWQGRAVRVEFSHRVSLADLAAVPAAILQSIEPLPEDLTGLAGDGLALTFSDPRGAVVLTLLIHEQLLEMVCEFGDQELQVWLHDIEVILTGGEEL